MAALSTFTSSSDVAHVIDAEVIDEFVDNYQYEPPVGVSVAAMRPGQGNIPVRFIRLGEITVPSGTHSETDDADDVEVASAEETITPGLVIFRFPIPDELMAAANGRGIPAEALANCLDAAANRLDIDTLASSTSATLTTGSIASSCTLQALRAARAYTKAQRIKPGPMGFGLVLHHDAAAQLEESMGSAAAPRAFGQGDMERFGMVAGYQGTLLDLQVFEAGNVAAESTGWSNFITPIGRGGGLGLVMNELPHICPTRGDDGELRATTYFITRMWYGAGLANRLKLVEFLSS
jgi:hypothetical protein